MRLAGSVWLLGVLLDLLTWDNLSSTERASHVLLIAMTGSLLLAIASLRECSVPRDREDSRRAQPN